VRLFLDQMFRVDLAVALRAAGHDVLRAEEVGLARADDRDILASAMVQQRVLVTLDGHFGDWAVLPLKTHTGVIRLRVHPATSEKALALLTALLAGRSDADFANYLVIAAPDRARWRRTDE
jgi:predicted nuclease of predicted toxin-antitoxin system